MGIYMYDVKFGDCFQIRESINDTGLIVDFGSMSNLNIQFIKIIDHFKLTKPEKLLLTHYHLDHLSGLLFMMNNGELYKYQFNEIFLPDVFTTRGMDRAIVLLFLEEFLDNCILPQKYRSRYSLLELMKYLCSNNLKVSLLSRGVYFDDYITLWPDERYITSYADNLLVSLDLNDHTIRELLKIASTIIEFINLRTESNDSNISIEQIADMHGQIDNILSDYRLFQRLREQKTILTQFGHSANIVFQNKAYSNQNILFTGDIDVNSMKKIEDNFDSLPTLNLYGKYKYIKIPHHGTYNHFYDFSSYKPENILIPNGMCRNSSYRISEEYYKKHIGVSFFHCSNCNWCERRNKIGICCNIGATIYSSIVKFV